MKYFLLFQYLCFKKVYHIYPKLWSWIFHITLFLHWASWPQFYQTMLNQFLIIYIYSKINISVNFHDSMCHFDMTYFRKQIYLLLLNWIHLQWFFKLDFFLSLVHIIFSYLSDCRFYVSIRTTYQQKVDIIVY